MNTPLMSSHSSISNQFSWIQFSHSVMSDSLQPHGRQHPRLPCPSPTPGACSNSCPSSQWYHPTNSSSVGPFSSHLQSFPVSGPFPMSQFFPSGGQSIVVSASASVHNISVIYFHSLTNHDNNNDNLYVISNQMTISGNFLKHLPCSFLSIFLSAPSLCVSLSSLFWKLSSFMGLSDSLFVTVASVLHSLRK